MAWAQSSWVAREIERLNPGTKVELVGIETRGDRILDVSLQSVEGKEFFVAELDDALKSKRVDFTVHSMKDLSLERPAEFVNIAIPRRENPRDALLFGPGVTDKIGAGKTLRIGTSSPRRLENIPPFLSRALPTINGRKPKIELVDIRGNVNTRLSRVHEPEGAPKHLDGVVLALAGLIRLTNDQAGGAELEKLLQGTRWMILPLRECPAAPAQGALAVECRADAADVRSAISKLHDEKSARRVHAERELLALWGGGCHQRFGATCVHHEELGDLLYIRGMKPDGAFVDELRWNAPAKPAQPVQSWDGNEWRKTLKGAPSSASQTSLAEGLSHAYFVAHSRACVPSAKAALLNSRVWTSGISSWFDLAEQGIWVEGCAEGLGFDQVIPTLKEKVLALPALQSWTILTHEAAASGWPAGIGGHVMSTYSVPETQWTDEAKAALRSATHIFWSSGSQFDALKFFVPANAKHACGPGKTASHLKASGVQVEVFPTVQEWRKWLKT